MSRTLRVLAALGVLAVIYVSLLPYEFQAPATLLGITSLRDLPFHGWASVLREDGLAHLLAYGVLAVLVRASLGLSKASAWIELRRDLVAGGVCAVLAAGLELLQQYIPSRETSLGDLLGGLIGTTAGLVAFRWFVREHAGRSLTLHRGTPAERVRFLLTLYVPAYLLVSLFPYDLPLSVQEFALRLQSDRHAWLWSKAYCDGAVSCVARLVAEIALAVPVGMWVGMRRRPARLGVIPAAAAGLTIGLALEGAQLFLSSGASQGLSVVTRAVGVVLGVGAGRWLDFARVPLARRLRPLVALGSPFYLLAVAAADGWFRGPWHGVSEAVARLAGINFLPFYYHQMASETAALASTLVQTVVFAPVGVGVWLWRAGEARPLERGTLAAGATAGLLALVGEAGKLFVKSGRPDPTDVLIAIASAVIAYRVCVWLTDGAVTPAPAFRDAEADRGKISSLAARPAPEARVGRPGWLRVAIATSLLLFAAWGTADYPLGLAPIAPVLVPAAALTWYRPLWAPAIGLAALPVFNLAPWSGRFFLDEFDLLLAVVIGVAYLRAPRAGLAKAVGRFAIALLSLSALMWLVATVVGLLPPMPLDQNAFSTYFSHYNALRTGKGFLWALLIAPLLFDARTRRPNALVFTVGMVLGLGTAALAAMWERFLFAGLTNFSNEYRITGTFSGVHTGGAFLEAYLSAAVPFAVLLALLVPRLPTRAVASAAFLGGCYGVLVTYARAGYLALAAGIAVLVAGFLVQVLRRRPAGGRSFFVAAVSAAAAIAIAIPIAFGPAATSRFATLGKDAETRIRHWRNALAMMDPGPATSLFGMGLGAFPRTYLARNTDGVLPTTYGFVRESGNTYLRLGTGQLFYFVQRARVDPGEQYTIKVDLRGTGSEAALTVPVCEKFILHSFECKWMRVNGQGSNGNWRSYSVSFASGQVGAPLGRFQVRRPTQLAIFNPTPQTVIDVDNVRLLDARGRDLLTNGDFEHGMDRWFFSTDSHLPWHIKNLPVQVYFEQGLLGFLAFAMLSGTALIRALRRALQGDVVALAVLASLTAFLSLGLFDSLFDEPRLTLLYFALVVLALTPPVAAPSEGGSLSRPAVE